MLNPLAGGFSGEDVGKEGKTTPPAIQEKEEEEEGACSGVIGKWGNSPVVAPLAGKNDFSETLRYHDDRRQFSYGNRVQEYTIRSDVAKDCQASVGLISVNRSMPGFGPGWSGFRLGTPGGGGESSGRVSPRDVTMSDVRSAKRKSSSPHARKRGSDGRPDMWLKGNRKSGGGRETKEEEETSGMSEEDSGDEVEATEKTGSGNLPPIYPWMRRAHNGHGKGNGRHFSYLLSSIT